MMVSQSSTSSVYAITATQKTSKVSAYDTTSTQSTQQTDKLAEMEEKYKDIYTPIPETYSQADEDLQTQKIYEAYPNYVDFKEFFKIVSTLEDGTPIQLGQEITDDQRQNMQDRLNNFYDNVGGKEAFSEMQKGAQAIR